MIQNIEVSKLHPHINNPRKDLGDLTELAESIKLNGVLQNLTVVPRIMGEKTAEGSWQDGYTVIIGHRRLAAAKMARLKEVPCAVVDMTPQYQVSTMLLENMQRNDLTIYEQAQGFQMLLDFGDSIYDIADRTGFSEKTVRRRVKLLELDQKKFKESINRGATLMDYAELNKINDIKVRNSVLDEIGTANFQWKLKNALEKQEIPQRKTELLKFLEGWAKPVKSAPSNSEYEQSFFGYKLNNYKKPKNAGKAEYCYVDNDNSISLYKKTAAPEKKKVSQTEKLYKERDAQIKELTKRAYQLRSDFVKNIPGGKKYIKGAMDFAMIRLIRYGGADPDDLCKLLDIEIPNDDEIKDYMEKVNLKRDLIFKKYSEQPERTMLLVAWSSLDGNENYYDSHGYNFTIKHKPNPTLDAIYNNLIALGYQMSDEEQALRDGTHELFMPGED
jgi:ParB-like partition proteins